ncbi:ScbA/BarX family gamma-butyrolactone biosynthesis protein [Kitasatospora aureofaciens]|uniref:ScbA/BarX family gamma-butyrolactone biosynthesis protein n=1 Tax=Kitasatospora aureofaciens TaxID=1894 RepID=UPI00068A2477|nr:ScbA/BarX family gamma-butyrolactone biosynthesis protein [Kitasatospora aureofaciens]HJD85491.1 lactone biosynthesis protein, mmfl [Kitasatospora aureofaciens]
MSIITAPPKYLPSDQAVPLSFGSGISFSHRLPAASVHKTSAAEVLLTDAVRTGDGRFTVGAAWLRDHFLHHSGDGRSPDPLLLAETVRQTLIHLSHRFHGVPQGHPFVLDRLDLELADGAAPLRPGAPAHVTLDVTCTRTVTTPRRTGLALEAAASVDGVPIGRAGIRWEVLDPAFYQVVRHREARPRTAAGAPRSHEAPLGPLRRLAPGEVGYPGDEHVLLARDSADAPGTFWLDPDPGHPVLFDHPSDHVAGMVLLEAFRQAGRALGAPLHPAGLSASFTAFAEPDLPVAVTVTPGPDGAARTGGPGRMRTAEVTAAQRGVVLATARLAYPTDRQETP